MRISHVQQSILTNIFECVFPQIMNLFSKLHLRSLIFYHFIVILENLINYLDIKELVWYNQPVNCQNKMEVLLKQHSRLEYLSVSLLLMS